MSDYMYNFDEMFRIHDSEFIKADEYYAKIKYDLEKSVNAYDYCDEETESSNQDLIEERNYEDIKTDEYYTKIQYDLQKSVNAYDYCNDEVKYSNLELIKERNYEELKKRLKNVNIATEEIADKENVDFNKINLPALLGVKENEYFKCILHDDDKLAAAVFLDKEKNIYMYYCYHNEDNKFSASATYLIQQLIKCSKLEAYEFIADLFDISCEDYRWMKKQKELLTERYNYILNREIELRERLSQSVVDTLKAIIEYMITAVDANYKSVENEFILRIYSETLRSYLADECDIKMKDTDKLISILASLSLLGLIDKYHKCKYSTRTVEYMKIKQEKNNDNTENDLNNNEFLVIHIPAYNDIEFEDILKDIEHLNKINFSFSYISESSVSSIADIEILKKAYPEYKMKYSKYLDLEELYKKYYRTIEFILMKIQEKGYVLRKELIDKKYVDKKRMNEILILLENENLIMITVNEKVKMLFQELKDIKGSNNKIIISKELMQYIM